MPVYDCGQPECGTCEEAFRKPPVKSVYQQIAETFIGGPSPRLTNARLADELENMADDECPAVKAEVLRMAADRLRDERNRLRAHNAFAALQEIADLTKDEWARSRACEVLATATEHGEATTPASKSEGGGQ